MLEEKLITPNFIKKCFLIIMSISTGILALLSLPVEAGLCGGVGTGGMTMKVRPPITVGADSLYTVGNRKYTIMELFGNSYYPSVPYGEWKSGTNWGMGENASISEVESLDEEQKERINQLGEDNNLFVCMTSGITPSFQALSTGIVEQITVLIRSILLNFFDSNLICESADSKGCIDLLGLTGGHNDTNGGLIKQLGKGVFMPFIVLAFLSTAIYMIYTGLYKHEYRASLSGLLWALFAFVLGILTIVRPTLVARAPYKATQVISSCMLNILSGGSCTDHSSMEQLDDQTCTSFSRGSTSSAENTQLSLSAIGCRITKGFTIDRWTKQQFGYNFDDLYTVGPVPFGGSVYPSSKLQGSPEDYCVNMYSSQSPEDMKKSHFMASNGVTTSSEVRVCNIALAYMAATTAGDYNAPNMEKIIATAAKDEVMWNSFTGNGRDLLGFSQIVGIIGVLISIIPLAITGLAYQILSTILMIFAPIFLLFAIHPGRGKRIFLGWLETVLGFTLKYFAIGLLLIVVIAVYQAAFQNTRGFMTLIFPLVLATTFSIYRKELINLIGSVSLGGTKLSNKAGQKIESLYNSSANKTKNLLKSTAAGYVGGNMAAQAMDGIHEGETDEERAQRYREARSKGVSTALGNELRRGRGAIANVSRASYQTKQMLERERADKIKSHNEESARERLISSNERFASSVHEATIQNQMSANTEHIKSQVNEISTELINSALKDSVNKSLQKVNSAITPEQSNAYAQEARLEIKEASTFNSILKTHSSSQASKAAQEYSTNHFRQMEATISDQAISLADELRVKGLQENEARNRAEHFMNEALNKVNSFKEQFDNSIELANAGRGRTIVKTFDAESIVNIKTSQNKAVQDLFDKSLKIE